MEPIPAPLAALCGWGMLTGWVALCDMRSLPGPLLGLSLSSSLLRNLVPTEERVEPEVLGSPMD